MKLALNIETLARLPCERQISAELARRKMKSHQAKPRDLPKDKSDWTGTADVLLEITHKLQIGEMLQHTRY